MRERTQELRETQLEIIERLGKAVEWRDEETGDHIDRMSRLCHRLGLAAGMSREEAELFRRASVMHDVGKIGVPDSVLQKPGPLDDEEWAVMKTHTTIGAKILSGSQLAAAPDGRANRADPSRALGRQRLPGGHRRSGDPPGGPHLRRLRRVRRAGLGPALQGGLDRGGRSRGDRPQRGLALRPAGSRSCSSRSRRSWSASSASSAARRSCPPSRPPALRPRARSKSPWSLPRPWATSAAAAQPSRAASRRSRPSDSPRRKPAENASPQPVVSTTSISNAGTSSADSPSTITTPSAPRVATTQPAPRSISSRQPSTRSAAPVSASTWLVVGQQVVELGQRRPDPVEQARLAGRQHVGRGHDPCSRARARI